MSGVEKGDYLLTTTAGSGRLVQGYGSISYTKDSEVIVTSKNSAGLNVRLASGGRVFRMPYANVVKPSRRIGEVPEGGIDQDDPRVQWMFEDAARLADRLGYCRVYDRIAEELGLPGRERTFTIKVSVSEGVEVVAKVDARSKRLAEAKLRDQFAGGVTPTVRAIGS